MGRSTMPNQLTSLTEALQASPLGSINSISTDAKSHCIGFNLIPYGGRNSLQVAWVMGIVEYCVTRLVSAVFALLLYVCETFYYYRDLAYY